MLAYIIRRLLWLIPVLFVISFITFILMHATPGGPWDAMGVRHVPPGVIAAIKAKYGLDQPWYVQYADYMWKAMHGDLGPSFSSSVPVSLQIQQGFPVSASLGLGAVLMALLIGIPLGLLAALNHNKLIDQVSVFIITLGISVPSFVQALLLIVLFSVILHALPFQFERDQWQSWIMPVFILGLGPTALMLRLTRSTTLDVLNEDYVRTARAKGLPAVAVNLRHVLRNALIPVITLIGPLTAGLVTGSFVVESLFGVPGIGNQFVKGVLKRDYGLLMGSTLFFALLVALGNLAVDITYSFIDPRITRT